MTQMYNIFSQRASKGEYAAIIASGIGPASKPQMQKVSLQQCCLHTKHDYVMCTQIFYKYMHEWRDLGSQANSNV